jgi:hypothetical protein
MPDPVVTDADRKRAIECIWGTLPGRDQVEAVARALAEERGKFLALADRLETSYHRLPEDLGATLAASLIRRAARDAP